MSDLDNFRQETKEWLDKNCLAMRSGAPSNVQLMKFGRKESKIQKS